MSSSHSSSWVKTALNNVRRHKSVSDFREDSYRSSSQRRSSSSSKRQHNPLRSWPPISEHSVAEYDTYDAPPSPSPSASFFPPTSAPVLRPFEQTSFFEARNASSTPSEDGTCATSSRASSRPSSPPPFSDMPVREEELDDDEVPDREGPPALPLPNIAPCDARSRLHTTPGAIAATYCPPPIPTARPRTVSPLYSPQPKPRHSRFNSVDGVLALSLVEQLSLGETVGKVESGRGPMGARVGERRRSEASWPVIGGGGRSSKSVDFLTRASTD